jgi:hypothetical protein
VVVDIEGILVVLRYRRHPGGIGIVVFFQTLTCRCAESTQAVLGFFYGCPEMYGCRSLGAQMALGLFDSPEHVDMQRVPKQ